MDYPILEIITQLKDVLAKQNIAILQAPPGAGKSTVLPLQLMQETWLNGKKIIMLEPRRLAARSVAHRMADLSEEKIGESIGYRIRFESKVSKQTKIEVVTEGILTRMIQSDNALEEVGLILFDEFHERSLQADLALVLSLQVQELLRPDLRILIMSATLDGEALSKKLNNCPIITSTGKQYPVEIRYEQPDKDENIPQQMAKAIRKALKEQQGDVLAFLPGVSEIMRTEELLSGMAEHVLICSLHGNLPIAQQQQAIMPDPNKRRKVVLATSIAETSLTIEGIATVIDSGYARVPKFDPRSGLSRLETLKVTKDAADQRAGRAGRLGPGMCYRLWTQASQQYLQDVRKPEILEADLAPLVLELAQWGITDLSALNWMTSPPDASVKQARELLHKLEALDADHRITNKGKEMLRLPTHPRLAHMLIEASSQSKQMLALTTDLAAILEERDPLNKEAGADLALRIDVLRKWRAGERVNASMGVLDRIERLAKNWRSIFKIEAANAFVADQQIGALLWAAYPERIAQQLTAHSERYKLMNGRQALLPKHDALTREPFLVIAQLDAGLNEGKIFLAAAISKNDLEAHAQSQETVRWDEEREMIMASEEKRLGTLVITQKPKPQISEKALLKIWFALIREKGLKFLGWEEEQIQWQARVMSLRVWRNEEAWPDVSEQALLSQLENWLAPFLSGITKKQALLKLDLTNICNSILSWELQQAIKKFAPQYIEVPSSSNIKLKYFMDGRAPVLEVRLQELFGMLQTPTVNEGRNKIMIHLLSPGYKPVQVTQDLQSFWKNTYHEVRKELRSRYPKHHWPEDPFTAEAVRGIKKRSPKE
jgi:ATP-dependent helicase HrpB